MNELNKNNALNTELNIVYKYLRKLGISHADAEDAVQETAYKYLLYYDSIKASKIRSWLIRVALNFYYDQCRKQQKYKLDLDANVTKLVAAEQPEEFFLERERNKQLSSAISKLKPHFKELLLLKYQSGLSYKEIAELLESNINSVRTNLFRARKQLAKIYREESDE
ncbi:RNA polymerase sigma factor [Neobacillus kokaensis]|uniref:DNA-directed RNA polymerase sigma-70 factor n=1 Tax=Neobacillus kokaensis TaxID=2759023 RepID=A0ABQ3N3F2_9BACI|nr:RNA polymerase sigma factor [Neobacillus kokaensis]GHH99449.1 DNA-directed RNA polymerase sigma-70 factor [Neobacillus kokaensis]